MDNGANTAGADDCPDEEGDASAGNEVSLHREKVTDLVNWKPDGRERNKPEDEEADPVRGRCTRVLGKRVWDSGSILRCIVSTPVYVKLKRKIDLPSSSKSPESSSKHTSRRYKTVHHTRYRPLLPG